MNGNRQTIALTVRQENSEAKKFVLNARLNEETVLENEWLSEEDSKTVLEHSSQFLKLFEDKKRQPLVTAQGLSSIGSSMFDLWLKKAWALIDERIPAGAQRLLLIVSDVSEILNLPWEILQFPNGDFAGVHKDYSVRRLPVAGGTLRKFDGTLRPRPLRILFSACSARGQHELDYEREEEAVLKAIASAGDYVAFESCDMGSFDELEERIEQFNPHIVHLTGHGKVDDDGFGHFVFENDKGESDPKSSLQIKKMMAGAGNLQCVFVSGCQTAQAPPVTAMGGICQGLIGEDIPLAIGWAASIADPVATSFATEFYHVLAGGKSVDWAIHRARKKVFEELKNKGDLSWALPVIYSSSEQSEIFDSKSEPNPPERRSMIQYALPGMIEGYTTNFVGRRRELQRILPALREQKIQTLLLTGIGGAGKSTLATRITRKLETEGYVPVPVPSSEEKPLDVSRLFECFGGAFLRSGNKQAVRVLQDGQTDVGARLDYLIDTLNNGRFVLVLDNFETNLVEEGTWRVKDSDLERFYKGLMEKLSGESRAIVTCRYLTDYGPEKLATVWHEELSDFPESSFIKFLMRDEEIEKRFYSQNAKERLSRELLEELHHCLGGTPRFLGQIREWLKSVPVEKLKKELELIKYPVGASESELSNLRDQYCNDIIASDLYSFLSVDSQKALSKAAVFNIPFNFPALLAVTGVTEERLREFLLDWQMYAMVYQEMDSEDVELWVVYGLLRGWLLDAKRIVEEERKAAHQAAGNFLAGIIEEKRVHDLWINPITTYLEARFQYFISNDYLRSKEITKILSYFLLEQGMYKDVIKINDELFSAIQDLECLSFICGAYEYLGDIIKSRKTILLGLSISQDKNDKYWEAHFNHELACTYYMEGLNQQAMDCFFKSISIYKEINNQHGISAALNQLNRINLDSGNYKEALINFLEVLEIRRKINDKQGESITLHQIASAYDGIGDKENAMKYYNESLKLKKELGDRKEIAATLIQIGIMYSENNAFDHAEKYMLDAIKILEIVNHPLREAHALKHLGILECKRKKYQKAISYLLKAYSIEKSINHLKGLCFTLLELAKVVFIMDDFKESKRRFLESLIIYEAFDDKIHINEINLFLGLIALKEKNFEESEKIFIDLLNLYENMHNIEQEILALYGLKSVYLAQQNDIKTKEILIRMSKKQVEIGRRKDAADTFLEISTLDFNANNNEPARRYFTIAKSLFKELNDQYKESLCMHNLASIDLKEDKLIPAKDKFIESLKIKQKIYDQEGEAAAFYQLSSISKKLGRPKIAIKLLSICWGIETIIKHRDVKSDFQQLSAFGLELKYTQDQFDVMLKEAYEEYQKDRGWGLIGEAFDGI